MDWTPDLDQDSDQDLDLDLGPDLELDNYDKTRSKKPKDAK